MRIDQNRLLPSSEARSTLPALLDAAGEGRIFHIARDRAVAAHLVPPNALIVTSEVEADVRIGLMTHTAAWWVGEIPRSGYRNAGDNLGRLLAWTWECDEAAAVKWFASYALALFDQLEDRHIARPAFGPLWWGVTVALRGFLRDGPIADYEGAIRNRLPELGFGNLFTESELAGHGRLHGDDDPWPDAEPFGHGWAKTRWRDIKVGEFVPDPALGYEFGSIDDWCRVDAVADDATLRQADGSVKSWPVDGNAWVPFRNQQSWNWGQNSRP